MKRNAKYNYVRGSRTTTQGSRTYQVNGFNLPSVTTILNRTKDQRFLKKWKDRIVHKGPGSIVSPHSRSILK